MSEVISLATRKPLEDSNLLQSQPLSPPSLYIVVGDCIVLLRTTNKEYAFQVAKRQVEANETIQKYARIAVCEVLSETHVNLPSVN